MVKEEMLAIIKCGMKAEMDSVTLYKHAAESTNDAEVKDFFLVRMNEEKKHYNYLLMYYQAISTAKEPEMIWTDMAQNQDKISPVISDDFVKRIGENQILFSAISTAVLLEKNGIDFYRSCEAEVDLPVLKDFYKMMADWEETHYNDVLNVQRASEVFYWQLNQFEPF